MDVKSFFISFICSFIDPGDTFCPLTEECFKKIPSYQMDHQGKYFNPYLDGKNKEESGVGFDGLLQKDVMKMEWLLLAENKQPLLLHQIYDFPLQRMTRLEMTGNSIESL